MGRSQRIRRVAAIGLAGVLLALTALSVLGAASTRRSAQTASRSAMLAKAYDRAFDAVAAEESLERKYRLEPGTEVRERHRQAGDDLQQALDDVYTRGTPADRELVTSLRSLHAGYVTAIARMFAAVDTGDPATVLRIDNDEVDPAFGRISDLVQTATDAHARVAQQTLRQLHRVETAVFATTVAGFGVGLALLAAFTAVTIGYQRALLRQAADSRRRAQHDELTGLANRVLLNERLADVVDAGRDVAVLILDLDRFKEVNDTLGHSYGDDLLRQVAQRVAATVRTGDTVARLSADEFAVLLPGTGAQEALALADRLTGELHRSFLISGITVDVETSIGAATTTGPMGADALLRHADIALYAAKDAKTGAVLYSPDMHTEDAGRLQLLGDLRRALDATDQLQLHYQPKVDLASGTIRGAEALLRWHHPVRGAVSPAEFIPIAETTGLINRLTLCVLRHAIKQGRTWLDDDHPTAISVNLSPRCLLDPMLVEHVTKLLAEFRLPATLLRLEVTETAVMANPALALSTLTELHGLGITLSIDDFGTGYSSMAYLKRLPIDELKIDSSFVLGMNSDPNDAALVRGAIDLGHNLGLTVVAEGVETATHVAALQRLGCDIAQGYHYARPMPANAFTDWLRQQPARPATGVLVPIESNPPAYTPPMS
ncbi:putative bifunctional diguanylate cyclase/phosphodiesterase [Actinoplanes sp. NPDC051513]|uniref:putative bifunctional diguanylate cyclase/phosphodiesterase n=1 Tax=Actinoplanes sp. NPDC051513 TaxID=3363908 RepID=UPI0037A7EB42